MTEGTYRIFGSILTVCWVAFDPMYHSQWITWYCSVFVCLFI